MKFTDTAIYILLKDVATLGVTVLGLAIAGMGLATWKKQLKGVKEFEVGYQLNFAVLKLRDAVAVVRHPFISLPESNEAIEYLKKKYPEQTPGEIQKNAHAAVYDRRWERIAAASTEVESHLLAAEFLWGEDIRRVIKPLNDKILELNFSLRENFSENDFRTQTMMQIHNVIYGRLDGDEKDQFQIEIKSATKAITDFIKTKIY